MSAKPTIVVLVIAVIGVVAALVEWRRGTTPSPDGVLRSLLTTDELPVDAVTRITLRRADEPVLVFERTQRGWSQTAPLLHPMDPFSIRQFAVLAAGLQVARRLEPSALQGERPAGSLGLEPPRAVVGYEWRGGSLTLQLGHRALAGRSYLRIAGSETVFVVKGELHERAVEMNPWEWRDRSLFSVVSVDADEVVIVVDGARRTVLRRDRKRWKMEEPAQTRMDRLARDELFSALGRAQCGGFIMDQPDDLSRFGLQNPWGSVSVTMTRVLQQDGEIVRVPEVQRLRVGSAMGVGSADRFAMMEGRAVVVRLPEPVVRAFFRSAEGLVDPTGTGVPAADVKTIVINNAEGELRFQRDLGRWRALDSATEVASERVQKLLEILTTRRAPEVEFKPYPRELERATVILLGINDRPLDTVRILHEPESDRWALENGDDVLRIFGPGLQIPLTRAEFGLK